MILPFLFFTLQIRILSQSDFIPQQTDFVFKLVYAVHNRIRELCAKQAQRR